MFILCHVNDVEYDEAKIVPIVLHHVTIYAQRSIKDCISDFFSCAAAPHRSKASMNAYFDDPNFPSYPDSNVSRSYDPDATYYKFHMNRESVERRIAELEPRDSVHLPALFKARAAFAEMDGIVFPRTEPFLGKRLILPSGTRVEAHISAP